MLPQQGGSLLGTAEGRIVIDLSSVEEARRITQEAAQQIGRNLSQINAAVGRGATAAAIREQARARADAAREEVAAIQSAAEAGQQAVAANVDALAAKIKAGLGGEAAKAVVETFSRVQAAVEDAVENVSRLEQAVQRAVAAPNDAGVADAFLQDLFRLQQAESGLLSQQTQQAAAADAFLRDLEAIQRAEAARLATAEAQTSALREHLALAEQVRAAAESPTSFVGGLRQDALNPQAGAGTLAPVPLGERMPTFLQFQFYPFIQLFNTFGAREAANVTNVAMGLSGLADTMVTLGPTVRELGRRLLDSKSLIGDFANGVVKLIPGLTAAQGAVVAVGAVMGVMAVAALALVAVTAEVQKQQEAARRSAEQLGAALQAQADASRAAKDAILSGGSGQTAEELAGLTFQRQTDSRQFETLTADLAPVEAQIAAIHQRTDALAGLAPLIGVMRDLNLRVLEARADDLKAQIEKLLVENLIPTDQDIQARLAPGLIARGREIVDALNAPIAATARLRDALGQPAAELRRQIGAGGQDVALYTEKIAGLNAQIMELLRAGGEDNTTLAAILGIEAARTEQLRREASALQAAALAALPLVNLRERLKTVFDQARESLSALVAGVQQGIQRNIEVADLARNGTEASARARITALNDEAAAIRGALPAMTLLALVSGDARDQVTTLGGRLEEIGGIIAGINRTALPTIRARDAVLDRLGAPVAAAQTQRDLRRRSGDDLRQALGDSGEDVALYTAQFRGLNLEIQAALRGSNRALAESLRAERDAVQSKLAEALATEKATRSALAFVSGQERISAVFDRVRDGIRSLVDAVESQFQRNLDFARFNRTATPEAVGERVTDLQDERAAITQSLPQLQLLAAVSDEARQRLAEARGRLAEISVDLTRLVSETLPQAAARAQAALQSQIAQIQSEMAARVAQITSDLAAKEGEIAADRAADLAEAERDAGQDRAKIAKDYRDQVVKLEDDAARQRAKILRDFQFASQDAIANRDALAFVEAERARDKALEDLKADGDARRQELDRQYADQNKAIDDRLAEQRRQINRRYDEQLSDARAAAQKAIALERQRAEAEIRERQNAYQAQFNALRSALFAEYGLRNQANAAIVGAAQRTADQVNAILSRYTGQQVIVPEAVYVPQTGNPYQDFVNYARGAGIPGFATGTSFIDRDGVYRLHLGEGVLNPATNAVARSLLGDGYTQPMLASAIARGAGGGTSSPAAGGDLVIHIPISGVGKTTRQIVTMVDERLSATLQKAGLDA